MECHQNIWQFLKKGPTSKQNATMLCCKVRKNASAEHDISNCVQLPHKRCPLDSRTDDVAIFRIPLISQTLPFVRTTIQQQIWDRMASVCQSFNMDSVTSRFDAIAICTRYQEANWRFHEQTRIKWITISSGHTARHTRKTCRAEEWNIPYLTTNALICNTPGYLKGVTAQSGSLFYLAFNVLLGSYHSESELEPRNEGGWKRIPFFHVLRALARLSQSVLLS